MSLFESGSGQPPQSVIHRAHVVDDLFNVVRKTASGGFQLDGEQILESALSSLDL
jgi:hypothetical protein